MYGGEHVHDYDHDRVLQHISKDVLPANHILTMQQKRTYDVEKETYTSQGDYHARMINIWNTLALVASHFWIKYTLDTNESFQSLQKYTESQCEE